MAHHCLYISLSANRRLSGNVKLLKRNGFHDIGSDGCALSGSALFEAAISGTADRTIAAGRGNPQCLPQQPYGDCPEGIFDAYLIDLKDFPKESGVPTYIDPYAAIVLYPRFETKRGPFLICGLKIGHLWPALNGSLLMQSNDVERLAARISDVLPSYTRFDAVIDRGGDPGSDAVVSKDLEIDWGDPPDFMADFGENLRLGYSRADARSDLAYHIATRLQKEGVRGEARITFEGAEQRLYERQQKIAEKIRREHHLPRWKKMIDRVYEMQRQRGGISQPYEERHEWSGELGVKAAELLIMLIKEASDDYYGVGASSRRSSNGSAAGGARGGRGEQSIDARRGHEGRGDGNDRGNRGRSDNRGSGGSRGNEGGDGGGRNEGDVFRGPRPLA